MKKSTNTYYMLLKSGEYAEDEQITLLANAHNCSLTVRVLGQRKIEREDGRTELADVCTIDVRIPQDAEGVV